MQARQPAGFRDEYDPFVALLIALIERSRLDLAYPSDSQSNMRPSEQEKQTAAWFLEELVQSACRRTDLY